jgi:hypothetical protein
MMEAAPSVQSSQQSEPSIVRALSFLGHTLRHR